MCNFDIATTTVCPEMFHVMQYLSDMVWASIVQILSVHLLPYLKGNDKKPKLLSYANSAEGPGFNPGHGAVQELHLSWMSIT